MKYSNKIKELSRNDIKQITRDYFIQTLKKLEQEDNLQEFKHKSFSSLRDDPAYQHETTYKEIEAAKYNHLTKTRIMEPYPALKSKFIEGDVKKWSMQKLTFEQMQEKLRLHNPIPVNDEIDVEKVKDYILEHFNVDKEAIKYSKSETLLTQSITRMIRVIDKVLAYQQDSTLDIPEDEVYGDIIEAHYSGNAVYYLSELFPRYLTEQHIAETTHYTKLAAMNMFIQLMGDMVVSHITRVHVRQYKEYLMKLPSHIHQKHKGADLRALANIKRKPEECMAKSTMNNYITSIRAFYSWCLVEGYCEGENPFSGHTIKSGKEKPRESYNPDDLHKIFSLPMYTGCFSASTRNKAGSMIIKDACYWIPLILLFTGMRLEEATELFIEDIITDLATGIRYFDINANHHKRLKTKSSARTIPIPDKLIELGLWEYIEKNIKNRQLFEKELTVSKAKGKETFSRNVSKKIKSHFQDL